MEEVGVAAEVKEEGADKVGVAAEALVLWEDKAVVWEDKVEVWEDKVEVWEDKEEVWEDKEEEWEDKVGVVAEALVAMVDKGAEHRVATMGVADALAKAKVADKEEGE